jgi:ligand-binding sensor domain-containing protein
MTAGEITSISSACAWGRDRSLWVGTLDQGTYSIQGNKVDHFRGSDGLSGDAVSGLFQDREGNIWIVNPEGSITSMTFAWLAFPHGKD